MADKKKDEEKKGKQNPIAAQESNKGLAAAQKTSKENLKRSQDQFKGK